MNTKPNIMKSLLVLFLIIICTSCGFSSQETNKDGYMKFFNSYNNTEGVVKFSLPSAFVGYFIKQCCEEDIDELVGKLRMINFFIAENADKKILKDLNKNLSKSKYKNIMIVKEGSSSVVFKIRESEDKADEMVMIVKDNCDMVAICITGSFDMNDAKVLAKSIKVNEAVKIRQ